MTIHQTIEPNSTSASDHVVEIQSRIRAFLFSQFPAFAEDQFDLDTPLLDNGAIDSLGLIELVSFIEETYDVEFDDEDFEAENLESLRALTLLVITKSTS